MFFKIISLLFGIFSWFNFCFTLEVILSLSIVLLVYFQQTTEELSTQSKLSSPSPKADDRIKFTYFLIIMFVVNTLILNIMYRREHNRYIVKTARGDN